jgi:hypothetical protein
MPKDPKLTRAGVTGYNKPRKTPSHPTKSHVVVARNSSGETKTVRFGQQGVTGAGKNPKTDAEKARRKSYYARHNAQDAKPDILSARYWSHKVKWMIAPIGSMMLSLAYSGDTHAEREFERHNHLPAVSATASC